MAQNRTWTITQSDVSRTFTISPGVGQTGPAGPNNITTATETDITGILKGDGANVSAAVEDTDYQGVPAEGAFIDGDKTKLDGIEAGADVTDATNVNAAGAVMESDYSPAHSVLAQQSGTGSPSAVSLGTNSLLGRASGAGTDIQGLTAAQARTLLNVEDGATADQTGAEIKSLYEAEADTNAFTDAEKSKLAGIEAGADVTDAANVDAAGAVMETDLQSDIQANPSAPLKGDGAGGINVSYLGLETYILGGPVAPSGTPSWSMPNEGGVLANATNNDGEVGATGIDFAGSTEIGADLADADEILVSDGGGNTTRRKSLVSRIWTYIKAKIESVGLSSLNITGDLTVDTNTLQVNATTNEVTIAQDLYSQGPILVVNGFSGFDGGLSTFSVNAGTWNGSIITGNQSFSGQVELTGQAASTDDSAMTRSLVDQNRTLLPNCIQLHSMTGAASGTGATSTNDFTVKGDARLRCGSSAGAYSSMWFSKNVTAQTTSRINYSRRIELGGVVHLGANDTADGVVRLVIGASNTSAVPPLADADAMTAAGIGIEFDFDSGGSNKRARIIYHDGTTYKQSAWVTYVTAPGLGSRPVSYQITNVGDGNIHLRLSVAASTHNGANPLNNVAASVSVSDGPTGTGNLNENAILASAVQNSASYVNYETAVFLPMMLKIN